MFMFLAKYQDKWVLAEKNGYFVIENFSWDTVSNFEWDSVNRGKFIELDNFSQKIDQVPLPVSTKLICVGRNYADHAKELGNEVPKEPLLFFKPSSSLLPNNGLIELPIISEHVDHEVELAIIISKKGKNIPEENAMDFVFGYTISLDITARDLQRKDKTWFRGKGFDTFAPVGPWICKPDAINLDDCEIKLTVNEKLVQRGNIKDLIFKIPFLLHYISSIVTLNPGDIILTGTPEGVGPIKSEDNLKATIKNIGTLQVKVK